MARTRGWGRGTWASKAIGGCSGAGLTQDALPTVHKVPLPIPAAPAGCPFFFNSTLPLAKTPAHTKFEPDLSLQRRPPLWRLATRPPLGPLAWVLHPLPPPPHPMSPVVRQVVSGGYGVSAAFHCLARAQGSGEGVTREREEAPGGTLPIHLLPLCLWHGRRGCAGRRLGAGAVQRGECGHEGQVQHPGRLLEKGVVQGLCSRNTLLGVVSQQALKKVIARIRKPLKRERGWHWCIDRERGDSNSQMTVGMCRHAPALRAGGSSRDPSCQNWGIGVASRLQLIRWLREVSQTSHTKLCPHQALALPHQASGLHYMGTCFHETADPPPLDGILV